jgi:hypothetical protein
MQILSNAQIAELTGRRQRKLQCEALAMMRIPFAVRPTGTVVVLAEAVERVLGAAPEVKVEGPAGRVKPKLNLN